MVFGKKSATHKKTSSRTYWSFRSFFFFFNQPCQYRLYVANLFSFFCFWFLSKKDRRVKIDGSKWRTVCPWLAQKNVLATHAYSLNSLMMSSHRQADRTAKMVASRRWTMPLDWVGVGRAVLKRFDWVLYIYPDILKT